MSDYYAALGVTKQATEQEIKKAYRKLAMLHHPDKGGSAQKFNEISTAYEVLTNPEKRRLYDLGGSDAVDRGHAGDEGGADIFDLFGGGRRGGRAARASGPRKGESVIFPFKMPLEEMYTGTNRKLRITRTVACGTCDGQGGSGKTACTPCQGRGVRVIIQRLGPGMISQSQSTCDVCRGNGFVIPSSQVCKTCTGAKIVKEKKSIDVAVPAGARSGQTLVISGEGDQLPGTLPGDIIVEFQQQPHATFERKGLHLYVTQKISLFNALTGVSFYIPHLDGHQVHISCNQVIKPGSVLMVEYEGMPCSYGRGRGIDVGNLYVTFDVVFPDAQAMQKLPRQQLAQVLASILPPEPQLLRSKADENAQVTEAQPTFVNMAQQKARHDAQEREWTSWQNEQRNNQQGRGDYDDDEEGGYGSAQPACQPM